MIGRTLGSYKIVSELGAGGMGVVYVAEHPLIGRKAAVKLLLPEYSNNKDLVDRFFNEARAATVVKHRGIVDIFDFGYTEDNSAYIVMEFLEGESLGDRIKRGRLDNTEAVRIARQVASALAAAHEAGIIHRDLKPDNIFIIPDSEVAGGERIKVLDFGIAKLTKHHTPGASKTQTGQLMGSPLYMAPEQCKGAASVDARADVYSLGCVLYEMVCGRPIFDGNAAGEVIAKQIYETPDPPSAFVSGIPPAVESVIMQALSKQPEARFESMRAIISALDMATEGKLVVAGGKPKTYNSDAVAETVAPSEPPHLIQTPVPGMVQTPAPIPASVPVQTPVPGYPLTPVPGSVASPTAAPAPSQTTLGTAAAELTNSDFETGVEGRKRGWGFLAAAAVVLVGGGGVYALTRGAGNQDTQAAAEPAGPQTGTASASAPDEPIPGPTPTADAAIAEVTSVKIEITSEPSGAAIYRVSDGLRIGTTPHRQTFDRSNAVLDLILKRRDYRDQPVSVPLTEDLVLRETLDRKRSSRGRTTRASAAKPTHQPAKPTAGKPKPPAKDPVVDKPKPVTTQKPPVVAKPTGKGPKKDPPADKPKPKKPKDRKWGETLNPLDD